MIRGFVSRRLTTTATTATTAATPISAKASDNLMQMLRQRNSKSAAVANTSGYKRQWQGNEWRNQVLIWTGVFGGFFVWAAWYGRNIQLRNSPLFKGVLFTLRQDAQVAEWVGANIKPDTIVRGYINHIKGRADVSFGISGQTGSGSVHLKAVRSGDEWLVQELSCVVAGEEILRVANPEVTHLGAQ